MAVLRVAGEFESVKVVAGSPSFTTTAGRFDPDFSFGAMVNNTAGGGVAFALTALGALATVYVHCLMWSFGISATDLVLLRNAGGQTVLRLSAVSGTTVQLQYYNGLTYTSIGSPVTIAAQTLVTFDLVCKIDNTVGEFSGYVNGTLAWQFTGDTDVFAGSEVTSIEFQSVDSVIGTAWSEIIAADALTVGQRLATMHPNGSGATSAWTGAYTDIDEVGLPNDSDFISSATANQVSTFALENLSSAASAYDVLAVAVNARARKGVTGPANLQLAVHTGGNDYFSGNVTGLTTSFLSEFHNVWNTNPNTSAPWTVSDVQSLEAGVKSIT